MFDSTFHIPLRFYTAPQKQDRFKPHATTRTYALITDTSHLPEFQITVPKSTSSATVTLKSTLTEGSVGTLNLGSGLYFKDFLAHGLMIHDRTTTVSMTEGEYYLDITVGSDHFYSEVFAVTSITDKMILTYYNGHDLGGIDYTNTGHSQYKQTFIFDGTLARPEYQIEEEAVEDGEGNQLITFQRRVKLFKMWFYAPEYVADAMSLVGLHDYVSLTTHYGMPESETGSIYDFSATAEWIESKGLAKITCDFRDTPVIKTNCSDSIV